MKKIINILKEFPVIAALCAVADLVVTYYFTVLSMKEEHVAIVYFVALYGTVFGMTILGIGWDHACKKADKKTAERLRKIKRPTVYSAYYKDFYSITENIT